MDEFLFMGKPMAFWEELLRMSGNMNVTRIILENGKLRAKVAHYECMLRQMEMFRNTIDQNMSL